MSFPLQRRPVALVLALVVVAAASFVAGRWSARPGPEPSSYAVEAVERGALPGTRFTSPFIEGSGVRDRTRSLRRLRAELVRFVEGRAAVDPGLEVAVYLRDLLDGPWIGIREREPFTPASLMKVAVLMHALERMEADPELAGALRRYPGAGAMPSPDNLGDAPERRMEPGRDYTFAEVVERMIVDSDNHAKDLVLQGVDPAAVDELMLRLGVPARTEGGALVMDARSYATLLRILYTSSVFSRRSSEWALELLSRSRFDRGVRAGLPDGVAFAGKFGIHRDPDGPRGGAQLHECGIVYAPEHPYLLCVMTRTRTPGRADELAAVIAGISRLAWERRSPTGAP